jgi:hypothetical protein
MFSASSAEQWNISDACLPGIASNSLKNLGIGWVSGDGVSFAPKVVGSNGEKANKFVVPNGNR